MSTDLFGEFVVPRAPSEPFEVYCSPKRDGNFERCQLMRDGADSQDPNRALTYYKGAAAPSNGNATLAGQVTLASGATCGVISPFFDREVTATVELLDASGQLLTAPLRVNAHGDYLFDLELSGPTTLQLRARCEEAQQTLVSVDVDPSIQPAITIANLTLDNHSPVLTSLTAHVGDRQLAGGDLLPASATLPSDALPEAFRFLTTKGIDDAQSACAYYQAIGAVAQCNGDGSFERAITFDQWREAHAMAPYNVTPEYTATYINAVDLNLTRRHHGVRLAPGRLAFYVCNYPGPDDDSQEAVNRAIDDAVADRNLVGCVAMDNFPTPGVNDDEPFIKFHIFDGRGKLTSSINLDGRGEKFAPGICVACHGGDKYAGKYPADGSGRANIGAHYLPYDVDNFRFSTRPELARETQLEALRELNLLLLDSRPTVAVRTLVEAWYSNSALEPNDYTPQSWLDGGPDAVDIYRNMVKPTCRTCHVALEERYDFDADYAARFQFLTLTVGRPVCGGGTTEDEHRRAHSMPNSKVTFDRLWTRLGATDDPFPAFEQTIYEDLPGFGPRPVCTAPGLPRGW